MLTSMFSARWGRSVVLATVTVVAGALQESGLIHYKHGRMTILDRPALEAASCECYQVVKEAFQRLGV